METLLIVGLVMLLIAISIRWWRICAPVVLMSALAWEMSNRMGFNLIWVGFMLLPLGLVVGVAWQYVASRSRRFRTDSISDEDRLYI
jgi:hypothetical protein